MAFAAVQALRLSGLVLVEGHECRRPANVAGRSEKIHRTIVTHLEVLEDSELGLFALVRDTLRGGVDLLLALLAASTQTENQVKRRLLLDIVVRERTAIVELLAGEDQALLVRWNTFLVADLALHGLDRVARLDFECDSFTREGLDEDLHQKWGKVRWICAS